MDVLIGVYIRKMEARKSDVLFNWSASKFLLGCSIRILGKESSGKIFRKGRREYGIVQRQRNLRKGYQIVV